MRPAPWRLLILIAGAAFLCLREPYLLGAPRMWAEEGVIYFAHAYREGFFAALPAPHRGHYSLLANVSTALATLVPLRLAPTVTTAIAMLCNLLPVAFVAWSCSPVFGNTARRAGIVAVLLLISGGEGMWLTTISVQFQLPVLATLILIENTASTPPCRHWNRHLLLVFSGLASPMACFLTPLFWLEAWRHRQRRHTIAALALTVGLAAQAIATSASGPAGASSADARIAAIQVEYLIPTITTNLLVEQFAGLDVASQIRTRWFPHVVAGGLGPWWSNLLGLVVIATVAWLLARSCTRDLRLLLWGAVALVAVPTMVLALDDLRSQFELGMTPRYLYAATVMLLLPAVLGMRWQRGRPAAPDDWFRSLALLAGTLTGALAQFDDARDDRSWSHWPDEVARFEADPSYHLKTWPEPWRIDLSGDDSSLASRVDIRTVGRPTGAPPLPTLAVSPPEVGGMMAVSIAGAPPHARGHVLMSLAPPEPRTARHQDVELMLYVPDDPTQSVRFAVQTDETGSWAAPISSAPLFAMPHGVVTIQAILEQPDPAASHAVSVSVRR